VEVDLRVTGPSDPPEELVAIERRERRRKFRNFVFFLVIVLGVMVAALVAINHWGL
jgi:hypothetical protein